MSLFETQTERNFSCSIHRFQMMGLNFEIVIDTKMRQYKRIEAYALTFPLPSRSRS